MMAPLRSKQYKLPENKHLFCRISKTTSFCPIKCYTQYVSKFGKPSSGHRTGKGQSSSQFQGRAVLKYVHSTGQLYSLPMLVRLCSKSFKLGLRDSRCKTWVYKRQRNQRSNCQHSLKHRESKGIPEKHRLLFQ